MLPRLRIGMGPRSNLMLLGLTCFAGCSTFSESNTPMEVFEPHITKTTCPLHHVALREAIEPLCSSGCHYIPEYYAAKKREFPWANSNMHSSDNYSFWRVRYCPACREAEAEWDADLRRSQQQQLSQP
jgi:hypothetical protein